VVFAVFIFSKLQLILRLVIRAGKRVD